MGVIFGVVFLSLEMGSLIGLGFKSRPAFLCRFWGLNCKASTLPFEPCPNPIYLLDMPVFCIWFRL